MFRRFQRRGFGEAFGTSETSETSSETLKPRNFETSFATLKPSSELRDGIELFNRGEYFAAHEALEDAWREGPSEEKQFLQGLVQAAVGMHHFSKRNLEGARGVLARAIRNLDPYTPKHMDIDVAGLLDLLRLWLNHAEQPAPPPNPPVIEYIGRE